MPCGCPAGPRVSPSITVGCQAVFRRQPLRSRRADMPPSPSNLHIIPYIITSNAYRSPEVPMKNPRLADVPMSVEAVTNPLVISIKHRCDT